MFKRLAVLEKNIKPGHLLEVRADDMITYFLDWDSLSLKPGHLLGARADDTITYFHTV
jgi:hypothetical protein